MMIDIDKNTAEAKYRYTGETGELILFIANFGRIRPKLVMNSGLLWI